MKPMVVEKREPVGSMGDDTPLALFAKTPRHLASYFKQKFAQVTNPPIDSLREELVMSLNTYLGRRQNIFEEGEFHTKLLRISSPILLDVELEVLKKIPDEAFTSEVISVLFPTSDGPKGLEKKLSEICEAASKAVANGKSIIILSDRGVNPHYAPVPMLMAVGAVHHHLIREGKRMKASIVAETGAAWEVHHFATLFGYGASAVNPYVAYQVIHNMVEEGEVGGLDFDRALINYRGYVNKGVLKVMSKMGISALSSYQGAQIFEAIGLGQEVIDRCFTGTPSNVDGIGFADLAQDILLQHQNALAAMKKLRLDDVGYYRFRKEGEHHAFNPEAVKALH